MPLERASLADRGRELTYGTFVDGYSLVYKVVYQIVEREPRTIRLENPVFVHSIDQIVAVNKCHDAV